MNQTHKMLGSGYILQERNALNETRLNMSAMNLAFNRNGSRFSTQKANFRRKNKKPSGGVLMGFEGGQRLKQIEIHFGRTDFRTYQQIRHRTVDKNSLFNFYHI